VVVATPCGVVMVQSIRTRVAVAVTLRVLTLAVAVLGPVVLGPGSATQSQIGRPTTVRHPVPSGSPPVTPICPMPSPIEATACLATVSGEGPAPGIAAIHL